MEKDGLAISSTVSSENEFVVMLGGRLTSVTSQVLNVYLTTALDDDFQNEGVIFDLFDLTYISSQGLKVIFDTQKKLNEMHKSMKVINARDDVYVTFDVSGFADAISVSST